MTNQTRIRTKTAAAVAVALVAALTAGGGAAAGDEGSRATRSVAAASADTVATRDGWAVPLVAPRPSWLTPELLLRVREAGGAPIAAPAAVAPPEDGGIRPGTLMVDPSGCTMNFVFRRRSDFAIGTAAHCVDRVGQRVTVLVRTRGGSAVMDIGSVIKRAHAPNGLAPDFALVRIRERLEHLVGGAIMEIGGPCGVYRGGGIQQLRHFGYPLGLPPGVQRAGVSLAWRDAAYSWAGVAVFGDSGSAVRTAGRLAAGNLTHIGYSVIPFAPGDVFGTRMTWIERYVAPWRLLNDADCG